MGDLLCFRCKQPGHRSADCPERTTRQREAHPPAAPKGAPERWKGNPVPPRRPDSEISADPHGWAERIRADLGWFACCGDRSDLYTSELRRAEGLSPIHQCQLRQIAAAQVTERTGA